MPVWRCQGRRAVDQRRRRRHRRRGRASAAASGAAARRTGYRARHRRGAGDGQPRRGARGGPGHRRQPAAETDGEGRFQLRLTPGPAHGASAAPGLQAFTEAIDVSGRRGVADLAAGADARPGEYETVVRPPPREAPQLTLEKSEITMTPGSLGDPFRVIESLPGVVPVMWPLPHLRGPRQQPGQHRLLRRRGAGAGAVSLRARSGGDPPAVPGQPDVLSLGLPARDTAATWVGWWRRRPPRRPTIGCGAAWTCACTTPRSRRRRRSTTARARCRPRPATPTRGRCSACCRRRSTCTTGITRRASITRWDRGG